MHSFEVEIDFGEKKFAGVVYRSIYPDIKRDRDRDVEVDLTLFDTFLYFKLSSSSYAKFRGVMATILRLVLLSQETLSNLENS